MGEPPSKYEPNADWPEEIKQAYEHLKIPSLYDAILANEKMSLEIRRQDRDLKMLIEKLQNVAEILNTFITIAEEEWEEVEEEEGFFPLQQNDFEESSEGRLANLEVKFLQENHIYQKKQAQEILMETHDNIRDLSRKATQLIHQLLIILPKKEGIIPHPSSWYPLVEGMLQTLIEGIERTRYQLLSRLEEMHINIVEPQPGEAFDPSWHHVLEHLSGGMSGTIAQVVRVGYRQDQHLLRLADVTIYT
jgi:molecular chaperone GrpE (heat shock protein)